MRVCWKISRGEHIGTHTSPYSYPCILGSMCRSGPQALSGPKGHTLIRTDRIAQYVQLSSYKLDTTLVSSSVSKTTRFNTGSYWINWHESTVQTGRGQDDGTNNVGGCIRSSAIGYLFEAGGGKRQLPPISLALQGARSICVSTEIIIIRCTKIRTSR